MTIPLVDLGPLLDPTLASARPELEVSVASASHPIALLPVRLETRFFARAGGTSELRIRVYPDKVHLDSHDPSLSAGELAAGRAFWQQRWRAASDVARQQAAWAALSDSFDPHRAAHIARALTPLNPGDRPEEPLGEATAFRTPPRFPDLGEPATVRRTPVARGLPARWVATAYRNGAVAGVAVGRDLEPTLPVGPDLDPRLAPVESDESAAVDEGMLWMVDFDRAEAAGMALRLPLDSGFGDAAVDVLVVSGVTEGVSTQVLGDLLTAHHHTDGLQILSPATPSNNTTDERSGWTEQDPRGAQNFAAEWIPGALGASGEALTRALGLPATTFERTPGADSDDLTAAEAMATALWPATWGYFLTQMVGMAGGGVGAALSLDDVDWARGHAQRHLRPGGPLPTIRCGRQPYGLLPVTSLNRYTDSSADGPRIDVLRRTLVGLRDRLWRPAQRTVPRIGASDNPSGDLADVLRTDAVPRRLRVRRLMGPHYLRHLHLFLGEDLDAAGFWLTLQSLSGSAAGQADLGFLPAAHRMVYEGATSPVVAAPVGDDAAAYLRELLEVTDLDALAAPSPERVPVLRALVRHGLLREHAVLAARLLASDDLPLPTLLLDAELVDLVPEQTPTPGWRWQRDQQQPGSSRTIREALGDLDSLPPEATRPLREFRDALGVLARCEEPDLERHLLNTLAGTSYRLDAWVTSLATRRLASMRESSPQAILLGGYGWLENLRPEPMHPVTDLPEDEPGPVFLPASDPGFIHAPSLDQASTAALLRNAHLAHGGGDDNAYAIQLTSARVRGAQRLLDGMRQGQSLGALLGYDFERGLHETHPGGDPNATLDDLLDFFRSLAPPKDVDPEDAVSRRVLLDGLDLVRRWREHPSSITSPIDGDTWEGSPRYDALTGLLTSLDRALDAVADAVTAESVHQLVRGNLDRASSTLEDITVGDATPPELQHQRTPRTGTPVTHRLAVVLDADAQLPADSGWAPASSSPRAASDPAVNTWLGQLLGRAADVEVALEVSAPEGGISSASVPLEALELTPADLLRLSVDASGRDELARRALSVVPQPRRPQGSRARIAPPAPGARTRVGVWDLLEVASSAYTVLSRARPLDGTDLQPPQAEESPAIDLDEYDDRAATAHASLQRVHDRLEAVLVDGATTPEQLDRAVRSAADFGLAVPADVSTPLARALLVELARRLTEAGSVATPVPGESDAARRVRVVKRFEAVFGPGPVPTPRFRCPTPDQLRASLEDVDALTDGDRTAGSTWSLRMGRVRLALGHLDLVLRESQALGSAAAPAPQIAQLPHLDGQRWVGLSLDGDPREGVVSLALQGNGLHRVDGTLAGLLVDEWTEIIPSRNETTGIAFRYDPPDAAPPQAILLAVPPVEGESWTVGTLNQVLLETLDLAHLRACGPAELDAVGHYLPAAVLAFNLDGDAVSTDLNALTPSEG